MAKSRSFTSLSSLEDLALLKNSLEQQRLAKEESARLKAEAQEKARREAGLFKEFAKLVKPLPQSNRVVHGDNKPAPLPRPRSEDEVESAPVVLSDGWDVSTMLNTTEFLSYRKNGVSAEALKQMRKGRWSIQAQIDLHGFRTDEARTAVSEFIDACSREDIRCVRIIHGKGLSSLDNTPVLKDKVSSWLVQKPNVTAFCQAPEHEGGTGALLVLLKAGNSQKSPSKQEQFHEQKQNRRRR